MKNYQCKVTINAPASAVFEALTTAKGLAAWWTKTCEVGTGARARSKFRFGSTYNVMQIEKLTPNREVVWLCIEQFHDDKTLKRKDEWAGTRVMFRLDLRSPEVTELSFEHEGLIPQLDCYEICENGWNHFLTRSLKSYVETGHGAPYVDPA